MYAVIRAGGKQYRVAPGDVIRMENSRQTRTDKIEFGDVLAVSAEAGSVLPPGSGASVTGEVVEQGRGNKIWDTMLTLLSLALLDPQALQRLTENWIIQDMHGHLATDYLTGQGAGRGIRR